MANYYQATAMNLLSFAVQKLFPDAIFAGGRIEQRGFSCDFRREKAFEKSELKKIEKELKRVIKNNYPIESISRGYAKAASAFEGNEYVLTLLEEEIKHNEVVVTQICGIYTGFAANVFEHTGDVFMVKVLTSSAAYWQNNENNVSLQRIHAIAFASEEEKDAYEKLMEEIAMRDNRKIGRELELFFFDDTAPGMPYWLPKGMKMYNVLVDFWRKEHEKRGYQEFSAPQLNNSQLWKTSGHWDHYMDSMFVFKDEDGTEQALKPMSCPNAIKIYQSKTRSYKDLPLRFNDVDVIHRKEKSGELSGLLRVRMFRQDDSHNFVMPEQIGSEVKNILDIAKRFYGVFGLTFTPTLSTRPASFIGEISVWDEAEAALKAVLDEMYDGNYKIKHGDGAFYGPKIDIQMKDALGREWQMGTIQLDFQLPKRFNISYVDKDGEHKTPVIIHRVIYGSLERFIGIITEHFAGDFPTWFTPVQVRVLPINSDNIEYARSVRETLIDLGFRVEIDEKNAKLSKKIMDAEKMKIPYLLIIGNAEVENNTVTVRSRRVGDLGSDTLEGFAKKLYEEVSNYRLP